MAERQENQESLVTRRSLMSTASSQWRRAIFMGPQRSRWRCPKRDGPGQIGELAVEIGFRFVNRMSHLATPDAFEPRNHSHSTGFKMPRLEDLWDMEQYGCSCPFWRPSHNGNNVSLWGCEEYFKLLSNHHTDSDPTTHDMVRTEWKGKKLFYAQTWKLYQ